MAESGQTGVVPRGSLEGLKTDLRRNQVMEFVETDHELVSL